MIRILRNLIISIIAIFILDREARHKFRDKYKQKSKFRRLRDDNLRLFNENKNLEARLDTIENDIASLRRILMNHAWLSTLDESPKTYLSAACIAKNEGPYLKEWIEYHKIVGIERFYFYDNESTDNTKEVLEPYINDGTVEYRYVEGKVMQIPVYQDAILKARGQTKWLAIIDTDEFIVPVEKDSVKSFLKDYEQFPGVAINMVCFDNNEHKIKPTAHGGLVTANYTRVVKDHDSFILDKAIKCIVNPSEVSYINSPNFCIYKNYQAVTENFEQISSVYTKYHSSQKIRINHYFRKSTEEFEQKTAKGDAYSRLCVDRRIYRIFSSASFSPDTETEHDFTIQKYSTKLLHACGVK